MFGDGICYMNVDWYYFVVGRVILYVDMNVFYCLVYEVEELELYRGKVIVVVGSSEVRKGVIVMCLYMVWRKGILIGMVVY